MQKTVSDYKREIRSLREELNESYNRIDLLEDFVRQQAFEASSIIDDSDGEDGEDETDEDDGS